MNRAAKHLKTGRQGEELGCLFLKKKGYKILARNFRCPLGEMDVIVERPHELIFVEIKTRTQSRFGTPEDAVGLSKQKKLVRIAQWYLKQKQEYGKSLSFGVLSINIGEDEDAEVKWIHPAFDVPEVL